MGMAEQEGVVWWVVVRSGHSQEGGKRKHSQFIHNSAYFFVLFWLVRTTQGCRARPGTWSTPLSSHGVQVHGCAVDGAIPADHGVHLIPLCSSARAFKFLSLQLSFAPPKAFESPFHGP